MTPWRFYRLPFNVVILNHAVCERPEGPAVRYCVYPFLSFVVIPSEAASGRRGTCCFLSFVFFFTLSSRTAHCADALRDLLFAWLSLALFFTLSSRARRILPTRDLLFSFFCLFLYAVIPNRALCGRPEGPAVRLA
jgi:hypothetical protein